MKGLIQISLVRLGFIFKDMVQWQVPEPSVQAVASYPSNSVAVGEAPPAPASLLMRNERVRPDDLFLLCETSKLIMACHLT